MKREKKKKKNIAGVLAETGVEKKKKKNKTKKIAITQRQKPFLARKIK